jgi:hypothetical protein
MVALLTPFAATSNDMEEKLMLEVNAANSKIVAETQEEMKAVEQYMSDIQDISHKFDFVSKHGSEKQTLLTPFAATSNGFIFPHVRCSSAMHDLQQISS